MTRAVFFTLLVLIVAPAVCQASNPPICPYVIDRTPWIDAWVQGAPWVKVHYAGNIEPAKSAGIKVFYRPWDADSQYHDDGNLPSDRTGAQYADMVWSKIGSLSLKPDAVGYRNEFNWDNPTASKRTCAEFVNFANRLRQRGYAGKIIFGSFGVGWVDAQIWNDTDLKNAVLASDGVETHEYFDLTVNCCAPWLAFRHRDLAIAQHAYLRSKEWYIGEFGSDLTCGHCTNCDDDLCRSGWRDRGKLTEQQYVNELMTYRAGCASQVVAVFVFQAGSPGWASFEVAETTVADYMKSTWDAPTGTIAGTVTSQSGGTVSGATVTTDPGDYTTLSGPSGQYALPDIPIGTYSVTAHKAGYNHVTAHGYSVTTGAATTANLTLTPLTGLAAARNLPNNAGAAVSGIVTAQFPVGGAQTRIYIEDPSRAAGLAINTTAAVSVGDEVEAQGTMGTVSGERVMSATAVTNLGEGAAVPRKLGMNARALGGGKSGFQDAVVDDAVAGDLADGLSNIGLLVRAWGKVSYIDPAGAYFYMDDGSSLRDGSGHVGVRVASTGLPVPSADANVRITGISSVTQVGGKTVRLLRPRSAADLSYAAATNTLNNPGFEAGTLANWITYGMFDGIQSGSWYGSITARSGSYFVGSAANWGTKTGGLYQRVAVPAGWSCQAKAWSRIYRTDNPVDSVRNRVGIDPTGGTNPASASIQWSPVDTQSTAGFSEWKELVSPAVTCTGGYVTIFLDSAQLDAAGWHINCFDDAALLVTAP